MVKEDVIELFAIACDYLKIVIKYIDIEFEEMENQINANFHLENQNYYYFRINNKWDKEEFPSEEFYHLLSIIVHECRHFYQLHESGDDQFMLEFITRERNTKSIGDWISYKMEQDAEAIRVMFISEVILVGKKEPKEILSYHKYEYEKEINNYIDNNVELFDSKKAIDSLSKFKERVSYIKY